MGFYDYYFGALFLIMGTVLGSFFNVVIYRMPLDKSVISPPSSCPNCGHMILWYENIPVLSWIFLRAKCSGCHTPISVRYPLVEMITGAFSLFLYCFYFHEKLFTPNLEWWTVIPLLLQYISLMLFVPIAVIDVEHLIIPNEFTIGGLIIGLAISFIPGGVTPQMAFAGAGIGAGILILFGKIGEVILKKEAMGWGDIKMLGWFGAMFGPGVAVGSIFIGAFAGLFGSIFMLIIKKMKRGEYLPFGPYLCLGALLALIWGTEILTLYLGIAGIEPSYFGIP